MIKILDKNIADKIAAGEVIDRPVSIIKELVENSLDAGASSITVEIRNGGKTYIRVTDNGCGIPEDETELAFKRHATSKIASAEDLDSIATLGFRGEALASICAVSRVELITRPWSFRTGRKISAEGSEIIENTAVGCPEGTTVTVRDLFYNVPARRKFLSADNSEARRITDMVSRISLAHGHVKFSLINSGKKIFSTRGNGSTINDIISIYGSDAGQNLLAVSSSDSEYTVRGYISPPSLSVPSRSRQIFCINGRVVSSKVLERGLEAAYKEKLFHGRFPAAFLFLDAPPEKIDVNIHPTKKEIRFDDENRVERFIETAVKKALSTREALPKMEKTSVVSVNESFTDYEPRRQEAVIKETVTNDQVDIKELLSNLRKKKENAGSGAGIMTVHEAENRPFDFDSLDFIGTVFNTYIIASDRCDLYLIDQHAAHERIFYEKLLEQYNSSEKACQQLLVPFRIDTSAQAVDLEAEWTESVNRIGYEIELFGSNSYIVRAVPAFMETYEAEAFLKDFFISLEDRPDLTDKTILEKIITRSCKSAVKGGDILHDMEIDSLMWELSLCRNPFSCPHGRPTFIRMTKHEIEKLFKRV